MKYFITVLALLLAVIFVDPIFGAPIFGLDNEHAVTDKFIVVLKTGISTATVDSHLNWANNVVKTSTVDRNVTFNINGFQGYSVQASKSVVAEIAKSDEVSIFSMQMRPHRCELAS
jgi:hypothetical protein